MFIEEENVRVITLLPLKAIAGYFLCVAKQCLCFFTLGCVLLSSALGDGGSLRTDANRFWPQWRGPLSCGVAPRANPPIEWSENKNVRWKLALPGKGHSTPVIWGDRVFLTTAESYGDSVDPKPGSAPGAHDNLPAIYHYKFVVLAVSRRDGRIIWQRTVRKELPHEGGHFTGSLASNSPLTDGEHVFAFFGSRGLYSLDMDGALIWEVDFGDLHTRHAHGEGASPALYEDTLVVNWDHQGESSVYAIDKLTGKQRWKVARDEITSWSTPVVVEHDGKAQVVISATNRVRSYNLLTGELIWECGGLSRNVVASPVAAEGIVYVASSYDQQAMFAIRLDGARGDITGTDQVIWTLNRHTPYVPSPLLYDGALYFLKHNQGILTCLNAKTGKLIFGPQRLDDIWNVFASPLGAAGRVYIVSREGATAVISHGTTPLLLASNRLEDSFSASPAAVDSELYLRGQQNLYCIARE